MEKSADGAPVSSVNVRFRVSWSWLEGFARLAISMDAWRSETGKTFRLCCARSGKA